MTGRVLSGPERRRRWSSEEKARLVAEIMVPGAKVTAIARPTWDQPQPSLHVAAGRRVRQLQSSAPASPLPDLVPVMITDGAEMSKRPALPAERVGTARNIGTIEIAFARLAFRVTAV